MKKGELSKQVMKFMTPIVSQEKGEEKKNDRQTPCCSGLFTQLDDHWMIILLLLRHVILVKIRVFLQDIDSS